MDLPVPSGIAHPASKPQTSSGAPSAEGGSARISRGFGKEDVLCLGALAVVILVVAWPALRGELWTHVDNAVHLAEIRDLARPTSNGWSKLAFCGFPLGLLQPPLTYGSLAFLTRLGLPLEGLYVAVSVLSIAAAGLAFYYVARRRTTPAVAMALASSIILYRGSLVGSAAALGGMFGFHVAAAAWLLVLDLLTRNERSLGHFVAVAVLAALVGSTHMYVTIALVYLGVIHAAMSLASRRPGARARLLFDLPALGLGALAAAPYWLSNVLAHTASRGEADFLSRIVIRLFGSSSPLPPPDVGRGLGRILWDPAHFLDVLPQLMVFAAAMLGLRRALREDDAPRYGAIIGTLFLFLMFVQPWMRPFVLGPQNERLIYIAKMGLALAAIPGLHAIAGRRSHGQNRVAAVAAVAVCFAFVSNSVVRREAIPAAAPELADLERVWQFVEKEKTPAWGRLWIQDTFGVFAGDRLSESHVLGMTAARTGVEQVHAYYGSTPYDRSDQYVGFDPADPTLTDDVVTAMTRTNATHLLLSDPRVHEVFEHDARFAPLAKIGRYLVMWLRGATPRWAEVLDGSGTVTADRSEPGNTHVTADASVRRVRLYDAYHVFLRAEPKGSAAIQTDELGMTVVVRNENAPRSFFVVYDSPRFPIVVGAFGVFTMTVLGLAACVLRLRRSRARVSARG